MHEYKGYWISGSALTVRGYGPEFHARGGVYTIKSSGLTTEVKRFEPKETFSAKDEAEAYGLKLARDWIDWVELFRMWKQCFPQLSTNPEK
jgi:hypothetical protein